MLFVGCADLRGCSMSERTDYDVVVVGAGFAGMYMLHRAAGHRACRRGCSRPATASAARGTGTAIPARVATSRAWSTRTSSPRSSSRSGSGPSATRRQPEILRLREPRRRPLRPARATSSSTRGCGRRRYDDATGRWTVRTDATAQREVSAQFLIMATGCLSSARIPDFPGPRLVRGRDVPHRSLAARGRRLHGQARRRDRHRLVGHPVDPDHRASRPSELVVFQRTASYSVPARNGPLDEEETRAIKADYAGVPRRATA